MFLVRSYASARSSVVLLERETLGLLARDLALLARHI